ncbi:MAG: hypothetical protein ACE5K8_03650 [Candidatus Zixiibacteriota bacterium]
MPDKDNKKSAEQKVTESQRFKYIGFEVFPGKPKDLFKSDEERSKLVKAVVAKRSSGQIIREECILLEERVSPLDRVVLAITCVLIVATLFIPWYTAYNEIIEESVEGTSQVVPSDSSLTSAKEGDTALSASSESLAVVDATPSSAGGEGTSAEVEDASRAEEIIHGVITRKKIHREYSRLSGIGAIIALGSVGPYIFSSGSVLALTGIIFLVYTLLCLALPIYTLYGVFGLKGDPDERALKLKKIARLCWIPVALFVLALIISFVGSDYGFDATTLYGSLGSGYGIGVFLSTLSWGIFISLCGFILLAAKGIEI